MLPLIIGGAALAGGLWWLASSGHDDSKAVPAAVVQAVAAAIKSGDPSVMRNVAAAIRRDGFSAQAASLEAAAGELEAAIKGTPAAKAGKVAPPVIGKGGERAVNPAPRADSSAARSQAGKLAQILSGMSLAEARGSAAVKAAVNDYQILEKQRGFYQGNIDGLFGPKAALTLAQDHGIVPPHPLYWPKKNTTLAKTAYKAQLARFAEADPQRREEWLQAMHVEND